MIRTRQSAFVLALLCSGPASLAAGGAGFATRDLNPILQPYYLPSRLITGDEDGWRVEHSFYITNTLQQKTRGDESLFIDVENYRYELGFGYRRAHWLLHTSIPFMANSRGELDALIEDWHDLFGFPQGKRDDFPRDQVNIEYQRDGVVEYSQTESSSGLGDISLAIGYQAPGQTGYFAGIELPTGSESDFSGNEAIDLALWISRETEIGPQSDAYGMIGISFPGDDGGLEGLIADRIWVAQLGFDYRFIESLVATAQLDLHGETVDDSDMRAFGESVQIQLGLGFLKLIEGYRLDLFFSEDILVGTAPDITFGLRLRQQM